MIQIISLLVVGFLLRIFAINWDLGFHFHPDERMLLIVADKINFFKNLNPDFFNYGSLPIYLLKGVSQLLSLFFGQWFVSYDGMLYVGRFLSALADVGVIYLISKIALLLFKKDKIAVFGAFFYTIAFFPIQNSHFFIVDTFVTLFVTLSLYFLLLYWQRGGVKSVFFAGLFLAAAATSKFTAIIFLPLAIATLLFKKDIRSSLLLLGIFFIFSFLFMPYAFIDYQKYWLDISLQLKLNSNPYIFPYTLQYVGTLPYLYYLKNIFIFGLGPFISLLTIVGLIYFVKELVKTKKKEWIIVAVFSLFYFLVVGRSAAKFMRYMLPIYPFLTILAGYGLVKFATKSWKYVGLILVILSTIWTFLFLNIYSKEHTRIAASKWIIKNIPQNSTLAVEHWDDRLPVHPGNYQFEELTLYDQPDNQNKWAILGDKLNKSDYIVIASNRLYVPIQRLNNCQKYLSCYPIASTYYQKLFNNELPFKKVAEFTAYPNLFGYEFKDDFADESFTVYDHPKIIIFKKFD